MDATKIIQLIMKIGVEYAPAVISIVLNSVQAVEDGKEGFENGVAKKSAAKALIAEAFKGIEFFKEGASDYQGYVMLLSDLLIDLTVAGFNLTGIWGFKTDLSNLPSSGRLD